MEGISIPDSDEDYWKEFEQIRAASTSTESVDGVDHEEAQKNVDEEEDNSEWLINAGFNFLSTLYEDDILEKEDDSGLFRDIMMTLTARQATAVRRRIDTYKETVRHKRQIAKHRSPRDVREVFSFQETQENQNDDEAKTSDKTTEKSGTVYPDESAAADHDQSAILELPRSSEDVKIRRSFSAEEGRPVFKGISDFGDKKKHSKPSKLEAIFRTSHKQDYDVSQRKSWNSADYMSGVEAIKFQMLQSIRGKGSLPSPSGSPVDKNFPSTDITVVEEEPPSLENMFEWGFHVEEPTNLPDKVEFPEAFIDDCAVGITPISDLGSDDFPNVRSLALIELAAIFDYDGLQYSRRKPGKSKKKETVLFGESLSALLENDRQYVSPDLQVPFFLKKVIYHLRRKGLKEQGILRLAGSQTKTENIRSELEDCYSRNDLGEIDGILSTCWPNELAALLKQFVRELPEPLFTNNYIDAFLQVPNLTWFANKLQALNLLMLLLPEENRAALEILLNFLADVDEESSVNLMTAENISKVMAPTLFPPPRTTKLDMDGHVKLAKVSCEVIRLLIKYRKLFWTIPPFLLRQVRLQHEQLVKRLAKDQKVIKLFLPNWKAKPDNAKALKSFWGSNKPNDMLLVQSSLPEQIGIPVRLTPGLTAKGVLESVYNASLEHFWTNDNVSHKRKIDPQEPPTVGKLRSCKINAKNCEEFAAEHELYEAGGNIGERKLPKYAKISAILRDNPMAGWMIRCKHVDW